MTAPALDERARMKAAEVLIREGFGHMPVHVGREYIQAYLAAQRPAAPGEERRAFWVIERFEDGRSAGYWDGGNAESFQPDIEKAVQFCRQTDAFWSARGWTDQGVKITEHIMLGPAQPSRIAAPVEGGAVYRS